MQTHGGSEATEGPKTRAGTSKAGTLKCHPRGIRATTRQTTLVCNTVEIEHSPRAGPGGPPPGNYITDHDIICIYTVSKLHMKLLVVQKVAV